MQAQRWDRLCDLFETLTTIAPQERESFMRAACGPDLQLRAELVSLLDSHGQRGPLDATPELLIGDADAADPGELPGAHVGPYRLLRLIGEGGMGSVWLAERIDGVVKRSVALKRPHVSWIGALAERAAQERDILASLEHPNIARLYDAGVTGSGDPYLALEFIDGIPITQFCETGQLTVRRRLELLLQVLEAVHYAHSRLIIHRDIKPSNILVSADARVHLLDFGIARLLHQEPSDPHTRWAGPLTPDYASPEQIGGDPVGTASDVYSVGVVGYEILTGRRPYRLLTRSSAALAAELEKVQIGKTSQSVTDVARRRQLKGDVDAILDKALRRDPARRYATVDAFAADIRRHLASQPVLAQPARLTYRLAKFTARYRWQTISMMVASAALFAGAAAALWQAHAARMEAARAEQVKGFALSILESADTDSGAGAATTAVELLQRARLRVESELAGRPGIAAELMTAIGYGLIGQDRAEDAAAVLKKAVALLTQVNGREDIRTVAAEVMYGEALCDLGRSAQALLLLQPAAERAHRLRDSHTESDAWRWLSWAQIDTGDVKSGVRSARAAVAALPTPLSTSRRARQDAIEAHLTLANALSSASALGVVDEGALGVVDETRAALALMSELDGWRGTSHWWSARAHLGLGLVREGQIAEGLGELEAAYQGSKALLGPDHEETEAYANYWGGALLDAGDPKGAVAAYEAALDAVLRRGEARGSRSAAIEHYALAGALAANGEPDQALPHFESAVRLFSSAGGSRDSVALRARIAHAAALMRLDRLDAADVELTELAKLPLAGSEKTLFEACLALLRSLQGRHDQAVELARMASAGIPALPSKTRQAQEWSLVGTVLLAAGRPQEAIAPLERSDTLFREAQVKMSSDRIETEAALARARAQ